MTPDEEPAACTDEDAAGSARPKARDSSPWRATGREAPVFFDERGRRGLVVRALGIVGCLAVAGALTFIVIGAIAFVHVTPRLTRGPGVIFAHATVHPPTVGRRGPVLRAGKSRMWSLGNFRQSDGISRTRPGTGRKGRGHGKGA